MRKRPETNKAPKRQRPIWFHLHFWLSWIAALPLLVVFVTGVLLSFEKEFYQWEQPEHYAIQANGPAKSLSEVLHTYEQAQPPLLLNYLQVPESGDAAYLAFAREMPSDGSPERSLRAYLNPYTGKITREFDNPTFIRLMEDLHRTLTLKKWGRWSVGASSLILAISSLIGLILWWPMRGRTFSRAWRRGRALDWHNALGLIALLPLCVFALTGITFTWGKFIFQQLDKLQEQPSRFEAPQLIVETAPAQEQWVTLAEAATWVQANYPDAEIRGVQGTRNAKRPYIFHLKQHHEFHPGGNLKLSVAPTSGQLHSEFDVTTTGPVGWYRRYFYILHTGHPFPWWGRLFWAVSSLAGLILLITGVWMSIRRWRRQRA
ncbi:PepSY-associated TM helix domain-containing protein [Coraliomargarita algicola]|uniref:PepSY-associated TM helix domain-containing protein n=1 Tax=Coraliomargarita algicola TaxID=3092156 RepID=A0ABZ0RDT3_9BACT|nr:PepSY-associated TM helix domain-containing protein [Coraliomargarita sp. J2-16]WPJ94320.1 PepSY-associated TM helix domain-containing protein [Coraliomargarita sp. J2-16]